jgi:hypothetical protein
MTSLKYVYQNDEVMIFKTDYDKTYLVIEKDDDDEFGYYEFGYYLNYDDIKSVYADFKG